MKLIPFVSRSTDLTVALVGLILTSWLSLSQAQSLNLSDGLEAYWTFDEAVGDQAGDLTGNVRGVSVYDHPTLSESEIQWVDGRFGAAVNFDGSYFLASPEYYGIGGNEPRTIAMWVKTDWAVDTGANAIVGFGVNATGERWHFKFETTTGGLRTENQGGNNLAGIAVNDGEWHHVVSVFPEGSSVVGDADHYVDGVFDATKTGGVTNPVNTNVDPAVAAPVTVGGAPFNAGLRFATFQADDVRIYSRALSPEEIAALAQGQGVIEGAPPIIAFEGNPNGRSFVDAGQPLAVTVTAVGEATLAAGDVSVVINGEDVTEQVAISESGASLGLEWQGFQENADYVVAVRATDSRGLANGRTIRFATFSDDNRVIEAENFNYGGGLFINDPVLCDTIGGQPDCYFDTISLSGIDSFDSSGFTDDSGTIEDLYRFSQFFDREEEFDTFATDDEVRANYAATAETGLGIRDYEIERLNAGDWANYTRTFEEAGSFQIYLRANASADQTVRLDRVTSDPSRENQELEFLGSFRVLSAGGFGFTTLTDASGETAVAIELSGTQTLRLTTEEANNDIAINYMMFVPAEGQTILPTVSFASPESGAVIAVNAPTQLRVQADDEDGQVTAVAFYRIDGGERTLIGEARSAPFQIDWTPGEAGVYELLAEATDNAGLKGVSEVVPVIADSEGPTLLGLQGSPTLNAIELVFSDEVDPTTASNVANYQITPDLGVTAAQAEGTTVILTTGAQAEGTSYQVSVAALTDLNGVEGKAAELAFAASGQNLLYGLDLYLTFDEGSGNTVFDLSAYGRDAGLLNDPTFADKSILWTDGRFGSAANFDGTYGVFTEGYFGVGGVKGRTISMWVRTDVDPGGGNVLVGYGPNAATQRWHFKFQSTNGAIRSENQGGNNFGSISVTDGEWHHIAAVFPDEGFAIGDVDHYVDGVLDGVKDGGTGNLVDTVVDPSVAPPVGIGASVFGTGFRFVDADVDDVRIYHRALSADEITLLAGGEGVLVGPQVVSEIALSINQTEEGLTIRWEGAGELQRAEAVNGPWSPVEQAASPYSVTAEGTAFFRVRQ